MTEAVKKIAGLLRSINGIDISVFDHTFLEKSLHKRMTESGSASLDEYCFFLEQNIGERTAFINSLHISYSEFFRNQLTFAVLERVVLPAMVLKMKHTPGREIRIWSAACAGGQEAYSLAILLEELRNGDTHPFSYRIFATDQSDTQIREAVKGHYEYAALHNVSLKRADRWFSRQDNYYTINSTLQENIQFTVFDLFNEELSCPPTSIFGDFDLVICANVLFYYTHECRNNILRKIVHSLAPGGCLITGEAERDIVMRSGFTEIFSQSAIFKRNMA